MTKREREGGEKSGLCFFLKSVRAMKREVWSLFQSGRG